MNQEYKNKALVDVARHNHARAAEVLLRHGAQIDWQDKLEQTALFEAVERGHQSVAVVLLRPGASLDITKRDGRTVFDMALNRNDIELTHVILDKFCSISGIQNTAEISLDRAPGGELPHSSGFSAKWCEHRSTGDKKCLSAWTGTTRRVTERISQNSLQKHCCA